MQSDKERIVGAIIDLYDELRERRFVGDYSGIPFIDSLDSAIENARLSDMQYSVIDLLLRGFSQTDVSNTLGIKKQSVNTIKKRAIKKIAKNYEGELIQ